VLGSDVNRLAELLLQICERHRRARFRPASSS
jgi:hypothetical protein